MYLCTPRKWFLSALRNCVIGLFGHFFFAIYSFRLSISHVRTDVLYSYSSTPLLITLLFATSGNTATEPLRNHFVFFFFFIIIFILFTRTFNARTTTPHVLSIIIGRIGITFWTKIVNAQHRKNVRTILQLLLALIHVLGRFRILLGSGIYFENIAFG